MSKYSACNAYVGYMPSLLSISYTDKMASAAVGLPWLALAVFNASFKALVERNCVMISASTAPGAATVSDRGVVHGVVSCRKRRRRNSVRRVKVLFKAISKTQK
jgi:hypothetical protein